jgi:hypothetical protein
MTGELAVAVPDEETDTAAERLAALFDAHHHRLYVVARRLSANADEADRDLDPQERPSRGLPRLIRNSPVGAQLGWRAAGEVARQRTLLMLLSSRCD